MCPKIITTEVFALLGFYAAYVGSCSQTLSDPCSVAKQSSNCFFLRVKRIDCPETSINNYQHTLCNNPEGRKPHLHRGGSQKPRIMKIYNYILLPIVTTSG